uniref:Ig-like domain-containing protein n=1 Tax=Buteo japonicus TaxID=224669 RepID=A0A8B9Z3U0_9AVES
MEEVRWRGKGKATRVELHFSYPRGGRYKGRTELSSVELNHGNLSLVLKNVTYTDKGEYVCSLDSESWRDETVVELDVTGQ